MKSLKAVAPFGFLALACIPCLVIVAGVGGGVLAAVGGTVLAPAVGIPLAVVGFGTVVLAGVWYRRRSCAVPAPRSARRAGPAARSSPTQPQVPGTRARRAKVHRVETRRS